MTDEGRENNQAYQVGRKLFGEHGVNRLRMLRELDPGFADLFEQWCYGGLYARNILDDRVRELCAVAALIPVNRPSVMRTHLKAALRCGATREDVLEVIFQSAVYAGMPDCLTTLDQFRQLERDGELEGLGPSYGGASTP
jgi:4-carboxymuconolactone decarboxylase